jgi:hypothetical protein
MRGRWWVLCGVAGSLLACGEAASSSPQSTSSAGSGGAAGSAGVASGGGGSGAVGIGGFPGLGGSGGVTAGGAGASGSSGAADVTLMRVACIGYIDAWCSRTWACMGGSASCVEDLLPDCPDLIFSPGSTRTVDGVQQCAAEIRAMDCNAWVRGLLPSCVTPGMRQAGEPCLYASQCESLWCTSSGGGAECGMCQALAEPNGTCGDSTGCPPGQDCSGTICIDIPEPPESIHDLPQGLPCSTDQECRFGLVCMADTPSSSAGTCRPGYPEASEPCAFQVGFQDGSCVFDDAACNAVSGNCDALPEAGAPCALAHEASPCRRGFTCDMSQTPPVCVARVPVGQSCLAETPCVEGASCIGADPGIGFAGICRMLREEGETCASNTHCTGDTACNNGVCVDEIGSFSRACEMP